MSKQLAEALRHSAWVLSQPEPMKARGRDTVERWVIQREEAIANVYSAANEIEGRQPVGHSIASPAPRGHIKWQPGLVGVNGTIVKVEVRRRRA